LTHIDTTKRALASGQIQCVTCACMVLDMQIELG